MDGAERTPVQPAHARAWELLPWFANGSLDAHERAVVRAHLGECLVCVRELRRLERLAAAVAVSSGEHACVQAYARLSHQLEHGAAPWTRRAWAAFRSVFEPVPLVAGAALLVCSSVLVTAIVLSGGAEAPLGEQPFQTLGRNAGQSARLDEPLLRVVLRDDVRGERLSAWLAEHRAEVVDGPSAIGVLTIKARGPRGFRGVLERLRADADTLFVEPVNLLGSRPDRRR